MIQTENHNPLAGSLIERMIGSRQLSSRDAEALARQRRDDGRAPVQTEEEVLQWLAGEYGVGYTALEDVEPDRQLLSLFPARVLLKEELLPLRRVNGSVEVATSRLFATQGFDALKTLTGLKLKPVLAPTEAIQREMKKRLGVGADTIGTLGEEASFQVVDEGQDEDTDLDSAAEDASIIRFVNQVLSDAIELRASDIHLEPFEDELRIRYRIDGVLQEIPVPAQVKRFQPAIVSRVKILSHLNIAEKRLPQDGRIKIRLDNSEVDIRVSVIPMLHGEAVVMRLLRQNATLLGMEELGMDPRELKSFRKVLSLPHGIILVTGPTGSGKTSTLYTALSEINDAVRKIITIEDPVEYQLKGINQIQVTEKAGLTFARGLRSILRHDPDVVLIGEIRDHETAQIAVQASLTGHLVFSTLHTNDAPGAVTRLVDMGVEPYLVASSLEAVLAQRLVRVLCRHCKAEDLSPTTMAIKREIGIPADDPVYRAVGCQACRQTGYHGRHAIFEWMNTNNEIRQMMLKNCSSGEIREAARRNGFRTLGEDGWRLVRAGVTTPEEVLRVTKDQHSARRRRKRLRTKPPTRQSPPKHSMPWFEYKALQADGSMTEGRLEATGRHEAFRQMEGRGLRPVRLAEKAAAAAASKAAGPGASGPLFQAKKITPRMLENFTRLLSSLLAAGVPLSRALVILYKEASTPAASAKWKEIYDLVIDGMSLADAMARSPETFPRVYVAMVQAGETGGFLDLVLGQIADFQAREKDLRGKVMTALLYPVILLCLALSVLVFLLVFFIPRFQTVFTGFGATLPLLTRAIVGVSELVRHYGLVVAVAIGIVGFLVRNWFVSEQGRRAWEGMVLRAPLVGPLVAQFAMARFCRMLGTLLGAGVPLVQALSVARKSIGNQILVDAVAESIERVKEGDALGESLAAAGSCSADRCWKWWRSRKKAAGLTRNWSGSPTSPKATSTGN